jgi:sugar phosphate isomerase/epimerase
MKFGYMSGFRSDLVTEIKFAKQLFDFTEITIKPDLLKSIDNEFIKIKDAIAGFSVLGHIHWEITDIAEIQKNIEVLKVLGAKKITIHPFQSLTVEENAEIFNKINVFAHELGVKLLIENVSAAPYNSAAIMSELLKKVPEAGLTLDIGHANRIMDLDNFLNIFEGQIQHVHLHDNLELNDHLFYENKEKLGKAISKLKAFGYNDTVLLETFSIMRNGVNESQDFSALQNLHSEQMKKIKDICLR